MKKLIILVALLFCTCVAVKAQECCSGRFEVFGGYSYLNISPKTDRIPADSANNRFDGRIGQHGFGINLVGNLSANIGIVADFSRNTADEDRRILNVKADTRTMVFLFGPRFSSRSDTMTAFGQVLIGVMKRRIASEEFNLSHTDLAFALGGGVDIGATKHFAIRLFQFDYIPSRGEDNIPDIGKRWSHNFRAQTGLVFRFGH